MKRLLFVCTGNTCRSPMAAAIALYHAGQHSFGVEVSSAGISAKNGAPITPDAKEALGEMNAEVPHRSQRLTAAHLARADIAFGMEARHIDRMTALAQSLPDDARPVIRLLNQPDEIPDPLGEGLSAYMAVLELFKTRIPDILRETCTAQGSDSLR